MRRFILGVSLPLLGGGVVAACFDRLDADPIFPHDGGAFDAPIIDGGSHDGSVPEGGSDAPFDAGPGTGSIVGTVYDFFQADLGVLPDVDVTVAGGPSTKTDANGHFKLDNVAIGDRLLVNVSRKTSAAQPIALSSSKLLWSGRKNAVTQIFPRLGEGCIARVTVSGADGGRLPLTECARQSSYASVQLDDDGIVRSSNKARFIGRMRVEIMPMTFVPGEGPPDMRAWRALPGDMSALKKDNTSTALESVGAAEFRLLDDATGEALELATGHPATIQVQVVRTPNANNGETFAAWWYDTTRGVWVEETNGTITSGGANELTVMQATVPHLTWWNADVPRQSACIRGKLTLGGAPVAGAVSTTGFDSAMSTMVQAAGDGTFCTNVRANDGVLVRGEILSPQGLPYATTLNTNAGDAGATCATASACKDLGSIALTLRDTMCVTGTLMTRKSDPDGGPPIVAPAVKPVGIVSNIPQASSVGWEDFDYLGALVPGAGGRFCLQLPAADSFQFVDDGTGACQTPATQGPFTATFVATGGVDGATCANPGDAGADGGSGCVDVGEIDLDCFYSNGAKTR